MFSSYLLVLASLLTLMLLQMYSEADVEALSTAEYPAVEEPFSGPAISKIAYISKTFVAYLEALMVSVSYFKTTGSRNRLELHLNKALKELNKHDDLCRPPSGGAGAAQRGGAWSAPGRLRG